MTTTPTRTGGPATIPGLARLRPLLGEINDTKRIRTAASVASLASRAFGRTWRLLLAGHDVGLVAMRETALAVAAARLGGIGPDILHDAGMAGEEIHEILISAIDAVADALGPDLAEPLRDSLRASIGHDLADAPEFVDRLARQPRAGATRPGHPRIILEPPEDHAEHCQMTAVYGVLVALRTGADPAVPFLAGLSHHFHNAYLPDSGFAGEELLGPRLAPIMARFTAQAMAQLPDPLAARVADARTVLDHAASPEARAFHAADVLDRVLQMEHYAQVSAFELRQALDDLELVHAGPLQAFQNAVLAEAGLLG